jgi:hypothetical protein
MKRLTPWLVSAGLLVLAADAQTAMASDFGPGAYAAMPPEAAWPGYGPRLLPPREITAIARESGFAPLGNPQQRGIVYTMSAINPAGDDGKLVIDARSGRIIRFLSAYRMGDNFNRELDTAYGPVGPLPPIAVAVRRVPRPPLPVPHVASRTAAKQAPAALAQQSALAPSAPLTEAKPPVQIQPTQQMPAAQGLD